MAKGKVLVVDDDEDIVDFLVTALEDQGYEVLAAVDWEALLLAHERRPDLILLDLMMPGMDGVEVSRRLRSDQATRDIPIVVMSAHDRIRITRGLVAADDRLPKPFNLCALYNTVSRWAPPA